MYFAKDGLKVWLAFLHPAEYMWRQTSLPFGCCLFWEYPQGVSLLHSLVFSWYTSWAEVMVTIQATSWLAFVTEEGQRRNTLFLVSTAVEWKDFFLCILLITPGKHFRCSGVIGVVPVCSREEHPFHSVKYLFLNEIGFLVTNFSQYSTEIRRHGWCPIMSQISIYI